MYLKYEMTNGSRTTIVTRGGITYELDLKESIDGFIYYSGCYEPTTTSFINKYVKQGMTILDIGANIGCHTLRSAKLVGSRGKVIAFEPMPWAFSELKRNVELNDFGNITLERLGLSNVDRKESIHFRSSWTLDGGSSPNSMSNEEVGFLTLDEYASRNNIKSIDLIKVDVDGYEYKVILGGLKTLTKFRPIIIIEFGKYTLKKYGDNLGDLIDLLTSLGYSFYSDRNLMPHITKEQLLNSVPEDGTINVVCRV